MTVVPFPSKELAISEIKAVAAYALWQTRRFDTMEIAEALSIEEWKAARIIHLFRDLKL